MLKYKILGFLGYCVISSIEKTVRWKIDTSKLGVKTHWSHSSENTESKEEGIGGILVFWHGDQLFMPYAYLKGSNKDIRTDLNALVSQHSDGTIATNLLKFFRIKSVRGSSSRGGTRALIKLKKLLENGESIAITPDGPKGPLWESKIGAVKLASLTSAPLIPTTIYANNRFQFSSWDRMFLPKPFSKVTMLSSERIWCSPNLSKEEIEAESKKLTETLNSLKEQAKKKS